MADWDKITATGNVEDRRGLSAGIFGGSIGIVGLVITLALNYFGITIDTATVNQILTQVNEATVSKQNNAQPDEFKGADDYEVFASKVVGSGNEMWSEVFTQSGAQYSPPRLVLFRIATQSGCGVATSSVGPHYCPVDQTIYLDETFFNELRDRFGAKGGDVAEAYVIAHELGHHVQNLLGTLNTYQSENSNGASVAIELQADCYAGLWANSVSHLNVIGPGEIDEAVNAAEAVGDDHIQESTQGYVNQETWTHGSSAQRAEWFNKGYDTGAVASCSIK